MRFPKPIGEIAASRVVVVFPFFFQNFVRQNHFTFWRYSLPNLDRRNVETFNEDYYLVIKSSLVPISKKNSGIVAGTTFLVYLAIFRDVQK